MSTPVESLLRIKRWKEDEARNRFALSLKDLAAAEEHLAFLEGQFEDLRKQCDCSGQVLAIEEIQSRNEWVERLITAMDNQKKVVSEKQRMAETARRALEEAARERKIFQRLDEKQREARERDSRRKEQIRLDEHAVAGHARKRVNPPHGTK
ncbi:MAG: flagellar export protein FliJ [Alphaproteobacteria bacterium]|uniref:Flagellar FliJ protein n=1 Tax=Candidatus Nitrobium versatile TaxID=2884831 RepID=A0A953JAF9_9BACT|nr:flagellar export protein FliJ [Candidatus Nitrobium versatile]